MNTLSKVALIGSAAVVSVLSAQQSHALTLVDFENGFTDGQRVGVVDTGDNQVTFQLGANGTPNQDAFIASPGGFYPAFGAVNTGAINTLKEQADRDKAGNFFLTDMHGFFGPNTAGDYFISFDKAVSSVSLDLLDFDSLSYQGAPGTYTATIFSDDFTTVLDSFTSEGSSPDGSLDTVSFDGFNNIQSLLISYTTPDGRGDTSTAIDNLAFETVPVNTQTNNPANVPTPAAILPSLFGMGLASFRKRFANNETVAEN